MSYVPEPAARTWEVPTATALLGTLTLAPASADRAWGWGEPAAYVGLFGTVRLQGTVGAEMGVNPTVHLDPNTPPSPRTLIVVAGDPLTRPTIDAKDVIARRSDGS